MFPTRQMLYTKEETEVHKKKAYILVAFVCFVLCFCITVQYKSVTKNSSAGVKEAKRTEELENQLINANQEIINLKKENKDRVIIIISHQKPIIKIADRVVVLKKGKL